MPTKTTTTTHVRTWPSKQSCANVLVGGARHIVESQRETPILDFPRRFLLKVNAQHDLLLRDGNMSRIHIQGPTLTSWHGCSP